MSIKARIGFGVSAAVIALATPLVMKWEGRVNRVYLDPIGIATVCDGHTGADVVLGQPARSDAECDAILRRDLQAHGQQMTTCITVDASDYERAAYLSFVINAGAPAFCRSTMARKLNAGDRRGACDELQKWVYAGGRKWKGLENRRRDEHAMCVKGLQ